MVYQCKIFLFISKSENFFCSEVVQTGLAYLSTITYDQDMHLQTNYLYKELGLNFRARSLMDGVKLAKGLDLGTIRGKIKC